MIISQSMMEYDTINDTQALEKGDYCLYLNLPVLTGGCRT